MARIPEDQRLTMIDAHLAHWPQVNATLPSPLLIAGTYGVAELQAQRMEYATLADAITTLRETTLPMQRAQRDGLWGLSPDDPDGVWFKLRNYRALVKAQLGARHPLARIIPNMVVATPQNYVPMCLSFLDHWTQVNAGLGASPLLLGAFTLANLTTVKTNLAQLIRDIETNDTLLAYKREVREQLFGDEADDVREATSIIARLYLYHATVVATFGGQPLGDAIPDIFPPGSPATLPTFGFNWSMQPDGSVKVWHVAPNPAWNATQVFLKEGADSLTQPVESTNVVLWPGITVIDDLDDVELRNAAGLTVATGTRDQSLPEPV